MFDVTIAVLSWQYVGKNRQAVKLKCIGHMLNEMGVRIR
jgi:hypothetical protein